MKLEEFDEVTSAFCVRWSPRSIDVVRALLVTGQALGEVATKFGLSPQHASELRKRFNAYAAKHKIITLSADDFMRQELPAIGVLDTFANELRRLQSRGYSLSQLRSYLKANNVSVSLATLEAFLGANDDHNENSSSSKPKRRRR